ncbi:MAG: hypothetical protein GMKNLPBB_00716 [Myxococcota bacterium]|nr:hypothetical protein [Myxococcota bacterium]
MKRRARELIPWMILSLAAGCGAESALVTNAPGDGVIRLFDVPITGMKIEAPAAAGPPVKAELSGTLREPCGSINRIYAEAGGKRLRFRALEGRSFTPCQNGGPSEFLERAEVFGLGAGRHQFIGGGQTVEALIAPEAEGLKSCPEQPFAIRNVVIPSRVPRGSPWVAEGVVRTDHLCQLPVRPEVNMEGDRILMSWMGHSCAAGGEGCEDIPGEEPVQVKIPPLWSPFITVNWGEGDRRIQLMEPTRECSSGQPLSANVRLEKAGLREPPGHVIAADFTLPGGTWPTPVELVRIGASFEVVLGWYECDPGSSVEPPRAIVRRIPVGELPPGEYQIGVNGGVPVKARVDLPCVETAAAAREVLLSSGASAAGENFILAAGQPLTIQASGNTLDGCHDAVGLAVKRSGQDISLRVRQQRCNPVSFCEAPPREYRLHALVTGLGVGNWRVQTAEDQPPMTFQVR